MAIGDLVANLDVNTQPWSKGLNKATGQAKSWAGSISSIVAPVAGMFAGVWGAKASVTAFNEQLLSARKLESVLKATGGAAGLTGQEISDYAADLQKVTNFEDDATVAAAAMLASFTNIRGDVFKDAIASAQDMTAIIGGDLEGNIKLLGKALNDPVDGLARLARAGVQFTQEQKAQIETLQKSGDLLGAQGVILDAVAGKFGGAAKATADPMKQLSNTIGDVAENIGALLLPSISVGATAISELLGVVVGGGETFKDFGIEAAVQLSSIGQYVVLAATQFELFFVQAGEGAAHFFTVALPEYLGWLNTNGIAIVQTFATNWIQVHRNAADNIGMIMREVWDYISTGGKNKMEFAWKPLTDGFINTIKELPDIPDRVVTDFEKSLAQSIEGQGDLIAESQAAFRAKLQDQFSPLKTAPVAGEIPDLQDLSKDKTNHSSASQHAAINSASLLGSQQAASIMLRGVGGTSAVEKSLSEQRKANGKLDRLTAAVKDNKPVQLKAI